MLFTICLHLKKIHTHITLEYFELKNFRKCFHQPMPSKYSILNVPSKLAKVAHFLFKIAYFVLTYKKNHWTKYVRFHLYCIHFFMLYDFTEFRRI